MAAEVEAAGAGAGVAFSASAAAGAARTKNPNKVRKRAPKACLSCRARKVRCDVSQRGRPCMNCYLDSETCVVTGRASRLRKSQRPAAPADASSTEAASTTAAAAAAAAQPQFSQPEGHSRDDAQTHTAPNASQRQQAQAHQHAHNHNHSHSHSHSHSHAHQHGSPVSDTASRHRTASIKGSPSAARESEPPQQPQQQQPQQQHSSPMAAPEMDNHSQQNHHNHNPNHNHSHQHSHHNNNHHNHNHNNNHSQFNNNANSNRFNSFHDDHHQQQNSFNRNGDFMGSSAGASAGMGGNAPWAAEQGLNISADITYSYYPFLAISNLSGILPQDVNYLELQGCLRVPTRSILDEFVQQYFLHVHPLLPLFNEGDFWELYCQQGPGGASSGKMSLLVFQALLFATCNFVSRNSIRALGFPTIRLARAALYRRAKLLYDFETESSPAAIAQAALLLSFWSPSTNSGTKNPNTAWLCTAIQQAKLAEANHYAQLLPFEARRANTLKRLWWCCIIRDRVMGLGVRRSIQITRAHFDLEANPPLTRADLEDEIERSRVYNPGTKSCLIEILVHMVELCVVLTDILTLVFPADDTPGWGRQMADSDAGRIRQCKIELRRWYKDVALKFPMFGGGSSGSNSGSPGSNSGGGGGGVNRMANGGREFYHDSVILYTNLMYMYYHSSRVALCHHEVLHIAVANAAPGFANSGNNNKAVPVIYENRYELQDAASGVTECLKELIQLRLARWLPISAVACTALPLFLHILDVKLSTSATNAASTQNNANTPSDVPDNNASTSASSALKQHRLNILIEAMKTYQPQYDGVDWVSETIRHIVNLANLDEPTGGANNNNNASGNGITDWTDILASNPSWYLRLALTMDLALSKNRMPEERDFPVGLRGLFTGGFSSLRNLRLGYNKDGSRVNGKSSNNNGGNGGDAAGGNGNMNGNVNNDHNGHGNNNNSNAGNSSSRNNTQYAPNNTNMANMATQATILPNNKSSSSSNNNNNMPLDNSNINMHVDVPQQSSGLPSATPNIVNMMDDPASVAAAMGGLAANAGLMGSLPLPGSSGPGGLPGPVDFAGGDYSAAFMLAPHHLAMSMGMAMGMDMDMDLTDMDMDMTFPAGTTTGLTPGIVTQLPSSDEETSPASIMSGTASSEAATSPQAQAQAHRTFMQHSHPNGAMLDAYTFNGDAAAVNGGANSGSPGTTATDVDDRHDHSHPAKHTYNIKHDKGATTEGDEWIEPSWDDEVPEMREGDRDTARALLEAIGEGA
ncbi:hypothetical protein SEUCBS139899_007975 [Sporothrix eucalyptigena]